MSILSDFEDRVSSAVEGVFAGVFRSPVQPAELARACAKEMDKRKKLGVGKVYAPTMYSVLLSPKDGDALGGFADTLAGELATYLTGYARERDYRLSTKPVVRFLVDDELKLGRYMVIGELLSPEEIAAEIGDPEDSFFDPDADVPHRAHAIPAEPAPVREPLPPVQPTAVVPALFDAEAEHDDDTVEKIPTITIPGTGHDVALTGERMVIGRLKACDICLGDANVSREHAALEREGIGWAVVDLGSTNGTLVNGSPLDRVRLRDGDIITIGISELIYHEPRS